ncbi:MAG: TonB-dependent receptor [Bryobacterales bacterium]|nr:TonB-dependent receptor [Bryobacterales bacterium]
MLLLLLQIQGMVHDPAGAPVAGARITLETAAKATVASTVSAGDGRFLLANVGHGSYVLKAEKAGFAEFRRAISMDGPAAADARIRLQVAAVRSQLTVNAETGIVATVESVAQPVTVISKDDLYEGAVTLSEAADGQTGVHQLRTSPTLGAYFVRGLTGKNVAVFRDGVRYTTSAQRGGISTFLNLINPEGVDSTEVLRGPNSAQYGSDSLGGTVTVNSRAAALTESGSHLRGQTSAFYQSATHGFGSSAAVDYSSTRVGLHADVLGRRSNTVRTGGGVDSHAAVTRFLGLPSTVLGTRLSDTAFTSYGGTLHGQVRAGGASQIVLHYERAQQDGGKRYDQLLGGDGNWIADLRNPMLDFGYLRYQTFAAGPFDQVSITASYNAQREERVNQGGQGNPAGTITHQYEKTRAAGLQFVLARRWRRVDWLLGGEGYREGITAPSFAANPVSGAVTIVRPRIPDGARYWQHGLYTQAAWQPAASDWVRLSGALRFGGASYHSRQGGALSPVDSLSARAFSGRFGGVLHPWQAITVYSTYSRGFRAPNVTDLGTLGLQGNGVYEAAVADLAGRGATIGDRADDRAVSTGFAVERLRPEYTDNVDYGVRVRHRRMEADFGGFWMRLSNTIVSQTLLLPQGAVGQALGEQSITGQLPSGAVFVAAATGPVLVRANFSGARMRGFEHSLRVRLTEAWSISENLTSIRAEDVRTGLPPDIEPGVPPVTVNPALAYRPSQGRLWVELHASFAGRMDRLSSLALSDRRIGNPRSRANIQAFFNNGARTRGLVSNGILMATGETLAAVQTRVLGTQNSAPQYHAIPGYGIVGLRGGVRLSARTDVFADFSNVTDKNYRGIGWGIDGAGRGAMVRLRHRF